MEITQILGRFEGVTEEPDGGYLARCPGHGDSRPSLRIWLGDDGKVRLACRAGCDNGDVVKAAGLKWPDLFNATGDGPRVPKERPQMVGPGMIAGLRMWLDSLSLDTDGRTAEYAAERFGLEPAELAELGIVAYRPGEPGFSGTSPAFTNFPRMVVPLCGFDGVARGAQGRDLSGDCPGRWVGLRNVDGQRWSPFGYFQGAGGYDPVIVAEGPGDALTAVGVGYDSVAIRGAALAGSEDVLRELAEGLRGRQVLAAGDADNAGLAFNRKLAYGLKPFGIEVYELMVPEIGHDLTDWRNSDPAGFADAVHRGVRMAVPVTIMDAPMPDPEPEHAEVVTRDQGTEAARILADLIKRYGASDAMNAHALVAWSDGRIKFAPGLGFYVWDGTTWQKSEVRVRQEVHKMGAALVLAGDLASARGFTMTTRIDALLTELRSVPSVYVDASAFDAKPDLLSFANGTVDLRTGQLRPHDKNHMLTVSLPFNYDPTAKAPRWGQFVEEIMPGQPEMPAYMQRLVGYGITGHVSEQCFAVLWGKGANGKSVFTETLTEIFGPITQTTGFATFEEKSSGGIPNDIAALRGARLVMASEGEAGKPMSEAVLKRATGKDQMTARFMRQEFFTFMPTFLIMLATNHKPNFRGADEGLWRRVKLVNFNRYFAPEERDYGLGDKLLAEAQGIIAWAVRGAQEWYREGLQDPQVVKDATRDYRETSDALQGFAPGEYEITKNEEHKALGSEVFNDYLAWAEAENLPQKERWRRTTVYRMLEERGVVRRRTAAGITLFGLRKEVQQGPVPTGPGIFAK